MSPPDPDSPSSPATPLPSTPPPASSTPAHASTAPAPPPPPVVTPPASPAGAQPPSVSQLIHYWRLRTARFEPYRVISDEVDHWQVYNGETFASVDRTGRALALGKGLYFIGCHFTGLVELRQFIGARELIFFNCKFHDHVEGGGASFDCPVSFLRCHFVGSITLTGARFKSSLQIAGCLVRMRVEREDYGMQRAEFHEAPDRQRTAWWPGLSVGGMLRLDRTIFCGSLNLSHAIVNGPLLMRGVEIGTQRFRGRLHLRQIRVRGDVDLTPHLHSRQPDDQVRSIIYGSLVLSAAHIEGIFDLRGIKLHGRFHLPHAHIRDRIDASIWHHDEDEKARYTFASEFGARRGVSIRMADAVIGHGVWFYGVKLEGQLNAKSVKIGGDFYLRQARATRSGRPIYLGCSIALQPVDGDGVRNVIDESLRLLGATIGGSLDLTWADFAGSVNLDNIQVSGDVHMRGVAIGGGLREPAGEDPSKRGHEAPLKPSGRAKLKLSMASIGRTLDLRGVEFYVAIDAHGIDIRGDLRCGPWWRRQDMEARGADPARPTDPDFTVFSDDPETAASENPQPVPLRKKIAGTGEMLHDSRAPLPQSPAKPAPPLPDDPEICQTAHYHGKIDLSNGRIGGELQLFLALYHGSIQAQGLRIGHRANLSSGIFFARVILDDAEVDGNMIIGGAPRKEDDPNGPAVPTYFRGGLSFARARIQGDLVHGRTIVGDPFALEHPLGAIAIAALAKPRVPSGEVPWSKTAEEVIEVTTRYEQREDPLSGEPFALQPEALIDSRLASIGGAWVSKTQEEKLPHNLVVFGDLNSASASFRGNVNLSGAYFGGTAYFDSARVSGDFLLASTLLHRDLNLSGAQIDGVAFQARHSLAEAPDDEADFAVSPRVRGRILLNRAKVRELSLNLCEYISPTNLVRPPVDPKTLFPLVRLYRAICGRALTLQTKAGDAIIHVGDHLSSLPPETNSDSTSVPLERSEPAPDSAPAVTPALPPIPALESGPAKTPPLPVPVNPTTPAPENATSDHPAHAAPKTLKDRIKRLRGQTQHMLHRFGNYVKPPKENDLPPVSGSYSVSLKHASVGVLTVHGKLPFELPPHLDMQGLSFQELNTEKLRAESRPGGRNTEKFLRLSAPGYTFWGEARRRFYFWAYPSPFMMLGTLVCVTLWLRNLGAWTFFWRLPSHARSFIHDLASEGFRFVVRDPWNWGTVQTVLSPFNAAGATCWLAGLWAAWVIGRLCFKRRRSPVNWAWYPQGYALFLREMPEMDAGLYARVESWLRERGSNEEADAVYFERRLHELNAGISAWGYHLCAAVLVTGLGYCRFKWLNSREAYMHRMRLLTKEGRPAFDHGGELEAQVRREQLEIEAERFKHGRLWRLWYRTHEASNEGFWRLVHMPRRWMERIILLTVGDGVRIWPAVIIFFLSFSFSWLWVFSDPSSVERPVTFIAPPDYTVRLEPTLEGDEHAKTADTISPGAEARPPSPKAPQVVPDANGSKPGRNNKNARAELAAAKETWSKDPHWREDMGTAKHEEKTWDRASSFWVSLRAHVPLFDLGGREKWRPSSEPVKILNEPVRQINAMFRWLGLFHTDYLQVPRCDTWAGVAQIFGWIAVPLILGAMAGLMRRRTESAEPVGKE